MHVPLLVPEVAVLIVTWSFDMALDRHPGTIHLFIGQFFKQNPNFDVSEAPKLISRVQEHLLIENPWILSNKIEKT